MINKENAKYMSYTPVLKGEIRVGDHDHFPVIVYGEKEYDPYLGKDKTRWSVEPDKEAYSETYDFYFGGSGDTIEEALMSATDNLRSLLTWRD